MKVLREKPKGALGMELGQVYHLGTKPKLMSKATAASNKAAKGKQKETMNPNQATRTEAVSRKPTISFADQQKENTWKYKLVPSRTIVVKYKKIAPPKQFWRRH